jgi:thioredoxin-like negative regulator of GroEL
MVHMRRAVRRAPDDPRLRARLAELYHAGGERRLAERNLELALHHSSDPEARERLGRLLEEWRSGGPRSRTITPAQDRREKEARHVPG